MSSPAVKPLPTDAKVRTVRTGKLSDPEEWGKEGHLVQNELQAFLNLRTKVIESEAGLAEHYSDTQCLLRFLRARKFKVDKSFAMIEVDSEFRADFRGKDWSMEDFSSLISFADDGLIRQGGFDKVGRPVIYCKPSLFFPSMVTDQDELVAFFVYYMDTLLSMAAKNNQEDFTAIADLAGWSMKNFSMELMRIMIGLLQNHYPERLGRVFVINAPWVFRGAWKMIYPLLDERTRCKIYLQSDSKIKETIAEAELEMSYGGVHADYPNRDPIIVPLYEKAAREADNMMDFDEVRAHILAEDGKSVDHSTKKKKKKTRFTRFFKSLRSGSRMQGSQDAESTDGGVSDREGDFPTSPAPSSPGISRGKSLRISMGRSSSKKIDEVSNAIKLVNKQLHGVQEQLAELETKMAAVSAEIEMVKSNPNTGIPQPVLFLLFAIALQQACSIFQVLSA